MGRQDKYLESYWYVTFSVGIWSRDGISSVFRFSCNEVATGIGGKSKSYAKEDKSDH